MTPSGEDAERTRHRFSGGSAGDGVPVLGDPESHPALSLEPGQSLFTKVTPSRLGTVSWIQPFPRNVSSAARPHRCTAEREVSSEVHRKPVQEAALLDGCRAALLGRGATRCLPGACQVLARCLPGARFPGLVVHTERFDIRLLVAEPDGARDTPVCSKWPCAPPTA